ncbi:MAG TPA: hypothetical protein PJ982_13990, partial [Lacipirellulaceae bacterium]|nr:hypothetical protein [Lacipirellulaceae bacterium]
MISRAGAKLPPERREIGLVFQDLALFPHLTAAQNIASQTTGLRCGMIKPSLRRLPRDSVRHVPMFDDQLGEHLVAAAYPPTKRQASPSDLA